MALEKKSLNKTTAPASKGTSNKKKLDVSKPATSKVVSAMRT